MLTEGVPWFDGLPPVTAEVECCGVPHRITWRRGKVVLDDHPDLTAERALAALASPCHCLDVLVAWAGAELRPADIRDWFLERPDRAPWQRTAADVLRRVMAPGPPPPGVPPRRFPAVPPGVPPSAVRAIRRRQEQMAKSLRIMSLPAELVQRWLLGTLVRCERGWAELDVVGRTDLQLALAGPARQAVVASARAWRRPGRELAVTATCELLPPGVRPMVAGRLDARSLEVDVWLPLGWLVRVWSRGLAVVDGCLVLALRPGADGHGLDADVVRWERSGGAGVSRAVTVEARLWQSSDGGWHLRWA